MNARHAHGWLGERLRNIGGRVSAHAGASLIGRFASIYWPAAASAAGEGAALKQIEHGGVIQARAGLALARGMKLRE